MSNFHHPDENWKQFLAIAATSGVLYFLIVANIFLPFILFTRFWWLLLCYIVFWYFDKHTYENGGRLVPRIQNLKCWKYTREYFPARLVLADEFALDPAKNYLFSCHPHGIFPCGVFHSLLLGNDNQIKKLYSSIKVQLVTLPILNCLPLVRDFFMAAGGISCSANSLYNVLSRPKGGHVVCLMTGGVQEVANSYPGTYNLVLNKRKGFIKIALQAGAPIVPVITFGENDVYFHVDSSRFLWLRNICKNWLGFMPVLFYGRGLTKNSVGWIPLKKKLTTVGKPINVEKTPSPTDEQINAIHATFVDELSELFHKYKFYLEHPIDKMLLLE